MKPTLPEVLPLVKAYKEKSGNAVGGSLHIVLDDGNISDDNIKYCLHWAEKQNDPDGVELARLLLQMSKTQRKKISERFYYL